MEEAKYNLLKDDDERREWEGAHYFPIT